MKIYTRSEWGAQFQDGYGTRTPVNLSLYAHHTVTGHSGTNATLAQDKAAVRTVERVGQQNFGVGMSYPFVIPPSGRIFQGVSPNRVSAHTINRNTTGSAISFIGNYDNERLSQAQIDAAAWLIGHGQRQGWWTTDRFTALHRDVFATACPGGTAVQTLRSLRASNSAHSTPSEAPAKEGPVLTSPRDVWRHRGHDYVNPDSPTSKDHQISKAHEYSFSAAGDAADVQQRIRRRDWAEWLGLRALGSRHEPEGALTDRWPSLRGDGFRAITWIQYAYLQARMARQNSAAALKEAKEANAKAEELLKLQKKRGE